MLSHVFLGWDQTMFDRSRPRAILTANGRPVLTEDYRVPLFTDYRAAYEAARQQCSRLPALGQSIAMEMKDDEELELDLGRVLVAFTDDMKLWVPGDLTNGRDKRHHLDGRHL
jgi:hypothetical protein